MAGCSPSTGASPAGLRRYASGSNSTKSRVAPEYPSWRTGSTGSRTDTQFPQRIMKRIMKGGRTTSLDSLAMRNDEGSSAVNADRSVRILIDPLDVP